MNIKQSFKNKNLIITIATITGILLLAIISLIITNQLSNRTSPSDNPDGFSTIDNNNSPSKIDGSIDIIPLISDSTGVDVNSEFKILSENKLTKAFFQQTLTVSPKQSYEIKQISDKEFHISFDNTLKPNSIYKIGLGDKNADYEYSWAFQTKKSFSLVRTLPSDRSTYVPIDSGIELSFSHEGVKNIEQYFDITPKVKGKFVYHNKTVVFMPENLEYGTIYTVTVKKGLGLNGSDDSLSQDYIFSFETRKSPEQENSEYLNFTEILYNFTPDTEPILDVYASENFKDQDLTVEVYKYSDESDLLENMKQYDTPAYRAFGRNNSLKFHTEKLQKETEFDTRIMHNNSNYWHGGFIIFPDKLSEGHYLVNIKFKDSTYQAHVQVNDMAVYAMAGEQENLIWLNSSSTGQPVQGASIAIDGAQTVKTDKDGIALIPGDVFKGETNYRTYVQQRSFFKIYRNESPVFLAPLSYFTWQYSNYGYSDYKSTQKYWAYLYTDRGLYMPTDTVQIWGMVRPRAGGNSSAKGVLSLHRSDYSYIWDYAYDENSDLSELMTKEIDISNMGTFNSNMELSNLNPGSYFIQLRLENEIIIQKYFDVRRYTKPAYKIDITPSKKILFEWEKLKMDIQASFFEGSPVSGLDLKYSYYTTWDTRKEGNIICDANGKASLEVSSLSSAKSWRPINLSFIMNNAKAEEEEIHAYSNPTVFPRDTMIEAKVSNKNQQGLIEVNTNLINLENLKTQSDWWYNSDEFRGNIIDIPIKIRIYEQSWGHEETGEYYDFINKKVRKTYRHFEVKNLVQELNVKTLNGKYFYEFPMGDEQNYIIEVEGYDTRQKLILETVYLYRYPSPYDNNIDRYLISEGNDDNTYKLGDTVQLAVKKNNLDLPVTPNNRFLFMTLKNGILSYTVENKPNYSFSFTKDYLPNIHVKAVYFDGKNIFNVESERIDYDFKEKDLIINISTDKKEYRPGDTVELDIEVKDINGVPKSAEVNISVVDEAFFAIYNQQVDTLAEIYKYCFQSGILSEYLSYKPLNIDFGFPEMGGEGGDQSARFMFKDNAFFNTIKTDKNGVGKASFKVPDNLTSWRITYQGIFYEKNGDELKAGSGKINIPVKLPFFVDLIFNDVFMDGDTVSISVRSFGTQIKTDKDVEYTVLLEEKSNSIEQKTYQAKNKGNNLTNIPLGRLKEGNYSVTVKAKQDNYSDAIRRDFKVVKYLLEAGNLESYKLSDNLKPTGGNSLTTLSFYNEKMATYYNCLLSMLYNGGERVDQKLAKKISKDFMEKYYGDENENETRWVDRSDDMDFNGYQQHDGGIALLTYDSSSPELTAKIASLSKDLFDDAAMKWYFYKTLENRESLPEDTAASLWGLAALNEPVLIEITNLLQSAANIGIKEKLYLGIGLAELGSTKEAQSIFDYIIKEHGVTGDSYIYIDSKAGRDDTIELTSLCSVLGAKTNAPEKEKLFKYVQDNSTRYILTNIENLIYLTHISPYIEQKSSFTVEVNGKEENITLDKNRTFRLILTPEALKDIKFSNIVGDIAVTSSYTGPIVDFSKDANTQVKIKRNYSLDGTNKLSFNQSDLIKITLELGFNETAPDGYYEVTDILPAGLRYVSATNQFDQRWYPSERDGQKVVFGFYYNKNSKYSNRSITYYARAITPGQFTADYTYVKHSLSDVSGFADRAQVEVK